MKKDVIAVVGAGKGGTAILETLLKMPDIVIRHVCDVDPDAPGMKAAREHGIAQDQDLEAVCRDEKVGLIFEATGSQAVYDRILALKHPHARVIGSEDAKIIFHLLDLQQGVSDTLSAYNLELDRRVQERTRELAQANATLQQINNEKTRYLMHSTHQLKAPFAAIQSYIDLILEGYVGRIEPRTREIVLKMQQRCMLLSEAIKEMLELANLKSVVRENIKMEEAPLEGIISSAVRHFTDLAASRKIRIAVAPLPPVGVSCNRNQILILLSTLLENAIHYSPDGSEIRVAAAAATDSGQVDISVQDHGIGIEKHLIGKIFDEYFRANSAVAVHEQGTGLGLAIAREIANIHGTMIWVQSEPGQGATFSFRLKTAAPQE
ncbi:MAG: ATP-binding protein [Elusimicrobia bacterium]|nr:ATP-binding protein [Elusimicrobiota bacterium]